MYNILVLGLYLKKLKSFTKYFLLNSLILLEKFDLINVTFISHLLNINNFIF